MAIAIGATTAMIRTSGIGPHPLRSSGGVNGH
ncbi:hypothetical protein QF035_010250 [Streptomyces umbrinus]|uniref:Uncharacterized protein n=1 Tax=Streptomyces umbrinus TaxID=67370 RepID=A0ABU0TA23_9ACTN|nr:hypothetical protein [Streptomyces umbrinus]